MDGVALPRAAEKAAVPRLIPSEELAVEIQLRKTTATSPTDYFALQYVWATVTGKTKPEPLDYDNYPDIEPASVAEFARRFAH